MVIRDLVDCEHERRLKKVRPGHPAISPEAVQRELETAEHDLASARHEMGLEDYRWATVKAYYSMLHMASAVSRSRGYVIDNHHCMFLFLLKIADRGDIESSYAYSYKAMIESRAKADYDLIYSREVANDGLRTSEQFLARMRSIITH